MLSRIVTTGALIAAFACGPAPDRPPNFVVILADDLGYADLAVYGSERNSTPHLDRMASEGLRFTDFHSTGPMCTPTRAALLTGLYPQRFGSSFEGALSGIDDYDTGLPLGAQTIAEALRELGYRTAMYGKWHLGYHPPYMPTEQGFDDFRGLGSGDGDHHSHIDRSGRQDWWHNAEIEMEDGYTADLITDHSVDFIRQSEEEPFFLYVAHLAIHFPWQGPEDLAYRVEGGDYHNLTKLGELDGLDVSSQVKKMVEAVDQSVGRILAALREKGIERETLVFFTSDNGGYRTYQGGYHNISENGPLRGQKTEVYEGGHRVPAIAWRPGGIGPGTSDALSTTLDLFPTFWELAGGGPDRPPLDGVSLAGILVDEQDLEPRKLYWRIRSSAALRHGRWKLVRHMNEPLELYDLSTDIGESNDVSAEFPAVASELERALADWEAEVEQGWE